ENKAPHANLLSRRWLHAENSRLASHPLSKTVALWTRPGRASLCPKQKCECVCCDQIPQAEPTAHARSPRIATPSLFHLLAKLHQPTSQALRKSPAGSSEHRRPNPAPRLERG